MHQGCGQTRHHGCMIITPSPLSFAACNSNVANYKLYYLYAYPESFENNVVC